MKFRLPGHNPKYVLDLWGRVRKFRFLLNSLPFVKEVAVCNNLSFSLAEKDSDIDLFIILDAKRFFTARLLVTFLMHIFGVRRHKNYVAKRFCLSFFIDTNNLNLSDLRINSEDYYFYYWFLNLVFLKDNFSLQNDLLKANRSWFEGQFINKSPGILVKENIFARFLEFVLGFSGFDFIENWLGQFQLKRARSKNQKLNNPNGVLIRKGLLKFHVLDARKEINSEVEKVYFSLSK